MENKVTIEVTREQAIALMMKAYWQGISQGMSMAQSQKSAQGA